MTYLEDKALQTTSTFFRTRYISDHPNPKLFSYVYSQSLISGSPQELRKLLAYSVSVA